MNTSPFSQIRKLTIALIISGACNVALAGLLFYWHAKELPVDRDQFFQTLLEGELQQLSVLSEQQKLLQHLSDEPQQNLPQNLLLKEEKISTLEDEITPLLPKPAPQPAPVPPKNKPMPPPPAQPEKKKKMPTPVQPAPLPLPNKKPIISSTPQKFPYGLKPQGLKSQGLKSQERFYIVQEGDSLWKIAKKFNVDVEQLRRSNQLENDTLQPGRTLKIP